MEYEPDPVTALTVLLAEAEDALANGDPRTHVGVEAAHAALTSDCDEPALRRLEYAPHHVYFHLNDEGRLEKYGENELLDSEWHETPSWWCVSCDTQLTGRFEALAHAHGIDLSGVEGADLEALPGVR